MSAAQLVWLKAQLREAKTLHQNVIICCHLCLHPGTCAPQCLLWNYDEVLQILGDSGNVVATFSGHAHRVGSTQPTHCCRASHLAFAVYGWCMVALLTLAVLW